MKKNIKWKPVFFLFTAASVALLTFSVILFQTGTNRPSETTKMLPVEEIPAPKISINGTNTGTKNSNVDNEGKKGFWHKAPTALEKALASQKKDPEWSRTIQKSGTDFLSRNNLDGNLISNVDCRETLCKIEFYHESIKDLELFKEKGIVGKNAPWIGERFGDIYEMDHENDKASSYMFFAPDGLPSGDLK